MSTKVFEEKIIHQYNIGKNISMIARLAQIHRNTVYRILNKNNIKLDKISGRPKKNTSNISFFKNYNKKSCYWAGFILADGCIKSDRNALQIALSSVDEQHLIKFSDAIEFSGKLYTDTPRNMKRIVVSSKWFIKDLLENYGIGPRKTLTIKFPKNIPNEFLPDFIRGIFDGDGSLTHHTYKNKPMIIFSGTKHILENMGRHIHQNTNVRIANASTLPAISRGKSTYTMSYYNKKAKIVLDWLYKYSEKETRLDRKYEKFQKIK